MNQILCAWLLVKRNMFKCDIKTVIAQYKVYKMIYVEKIKEPPIGDVREMKTEKVEQ